MTLQIEKGKYYRTRDGRKVGPAEWDCRYTNDKYPWDIPFPAGSYFYTEDGYSCIKVHEEDIIAEWKDTEDMTEDTPKCWKDMTDEEKGALLLAYHEGKGIQFLSGSVWFIDSNFDPNANPHLQYRVKPAPKEPKRETVAFKVCLDLKDGTSMHMDIQDGSNTYSSAFFYGKITLDKIDGVLDCDSIKMEEL